MSVVQLTLASLGLLLVLILVANGFAAGRQLARGAQFRQVVAHRVRGLRLPRMLAYFGIDLSRYLDRASVEAIEEQVQRCEGCLTQEVCDERMVKGTSAADPASFCPNYESLKDLKQ